MPHLTPSPLPPAPLRQRARLLAASALLALALAAQGGSALAAPTSLDGRLEVINDRGAPVTVTVDGDYAGVVAAHGVRVFAPLDNGVRVVRYTSPGAPAHDQQVTVPIGGKASLRIAPRVGSARITNRSGVPLRVRLDGQRLGRLQPGATLESTPLPAGTYTLTASPAHRRRGHRGALAGVALNRTLTIRAGLVTDATFEPLVGALEVRNPSPHELAVYVDGARAATVAGFGAVVLAGQLPGPHELSLRGRGRILTADRVDVVAGARQLWAPAVARLGQLRVTNHTGRPYRLRVGRMRPVLVAAGATHMIGQLPPGTHTIEAIPRRGATMRTQVDVLADQVSEVSLAQPLPAHRLHGPAPVQLRFTL